MPRKGRCQANRAQPASVPVGARVVAINPDNIDERVRLNLVEHEGLPQGYDDFLDGIVTYCSDGGTPVLGIPCTHHNPAKPYIVAEVKTNVSALNCFLVCKGTLYSYGFTVDGKWKSLGKVPHPLTNCVHLDIDCNYKRMKGSVKSLGPAQMVEACKQINAGTTRDDLEEPFKKMCHHINEPVRFKVMRDFIRDLMATGIHSTAAILARFKSLINNWQRISEMLREYESSGVWKLDSQIQTDTKLHTAQEGVNVMGILKTP